MSSATLSKDYMDDEVIADDEVITDDEVIADDSVLCQ